MKAIPTQVSIFSDRGNPIYNCIKIGPDDEAAGSFLVITLEDDEHNGTSIKLDWDEWDEIVKVVSQNRKQWEWE